MVKTQFSKIIARNKRATFDYQIDSRLIAGIVLKGYETKSIRDGNVSLKNSFANIRGNELWLNNVHIGSYSKSNLADYDPTRARKLLVHKNQLDRLMAAKASGLSIVVLSIGTSGRFIKVELGVGRGKKKYDKRQTLKKRDHDKSIQQKIGRK